MQFFTTLLSRMMRLWQQVQPALLCRCLFVFLACTYPAPTLWAMTLRYEITGITGEALKNVSSRLHVKQNAHNDSLKTSEIQRLYQESPQEIKRALQPFGYFYPKISHHLRYDPTGKVWVATFQN